MKKKFRITVDGKSYEVEVEEIAADTGDSDTGSAGPVKEKPAPGPSSSAESTAGSSKSKSAGRKQTAPGEDGQVEAPMSGKVLELKVAEGEEVAAGDLILVLEAMKMENEIYAPRAGSIKSIAVAAGDAVDAGDLLMEIE